MDDLTLLELSQRVRESPISAKVFVQVEEIKLRQTSAGKPFREIRFRDEGSSLVLRVWSDSKMFSDTEDLQIGSAVAITGAFVLSEAFGLETKKWEYRLLNEEERKTFFNRESKGVDEAWETIHTTVSSLIDPRLRMLCELFLKEYGARFRRAAAARRVHHARRGGLILHTAQMVKSAVALCAVYQDWNADLLLAGTILHDSGKLWETCPPEEGFGISISVNGELLGHITMGVELVNMLWKQLPLNEWNDCQPSNEEVRRHLLHLIVAHHGTHEFGSPVLPHTPEAYALHFIDNLDAKLEIVRAAYQTAPKLTEEVFERVGVLASNLVTPLPRFIASQQEKKE